MAICAHAPKRLAHSRVWRTAGLHDMIVLEGSFFQPEQAH